MSDFALFDHFQYADKIVDLVKDTFPKFRTVAFVSDPRETDFQKLALPAFIISYADPIPMGDITQNDFDLDDAYYMKIRINLVGELVLPLFPEANPDVPDLNGHILLATAATNVATLIYARASEAKVISPTIEGISYDTELDDYHRATIRWFHDVFVGSRPEASGFNPMTVFNRFTFPVGGTPPDESHEVYPDYGEPDPTP